MWIARLAPEQRDAARHLVGGGRAGELLARAVADPPTRECIALAALDGDDLLGVLLYGEVAGALGTGALLWLAVAEGVRRRGIGTALVADAAARLDGMRLIVAEVSTSLRAAPALLGRCGFEREGEVERFYSDADGMEIWVRRPAAGAQEGERGAE